MQQFPGILGIVPMVLLDQIYEIPEQVPLALEPLVSFRHRIGTVNN